MKQVNEEADKDPQTLRISMDAKATVKIGPFSRGGKSRVQVKAADHDFSGKNALTVTPVGIFLPHSDELCRPCERRLSTLTVSPYTRILFSR